MANTFTYLCMNSLGEKAVLVALFGHLMDSSDYMEALQAHAIGHAPAPVKFELIRQQ
jgi:hypothetical protein